MEDFYKLLHPCITLLIVSISQDGKPNVMTCAWSTPVSEDPPIVAIALSKESYTNSLIKSSGEFTVNIPSEKLLDATWICGTVSGKDVDKASLAGITYSNSKRVKPPIINECIGHLECRVLNSIDIGESTLFIGEVLEAYADKEFFQEGIWNIESVGILLHLGGDRFAIATKVLRPKKKAYKKRMQ